MLGEAYSVAADSEVFTGVFGVAVGVLYSVTAASGLVFIGLFGVALKSPNSPVVLLVFDVPTGTVNLLEPLDGAKG